MFKHKFDRRIVRLALIGGAWLWPGADLGRAQEFVHPATELVQPRRLAQQPADDAADDPFLPPLPADRPTRPAPQNPLPGRTAPGPRLDATEEPLRDPTTVAPDIRNILDPPAEAQHRDQLPLPRLVGRVAGASGRTIAVIEMNGQFAIVEQGSLANFNTENRGLMTVAVETLTANRAVVKLEQLNQTLELR